MTSQQKVIIANLASKLGLGNVQQAIKHVLGKTPINMSASRADAVITALRAEWEPIAAQQLADAMRAHDEAAAW